MEWRPCNWWLQGHQTGTTFLFFPLIFVSTKFQLWRLKICYIEWTFVITRFILFSFKNLKSIIGIAIFLLANFSFLEMSVWGFEPTTSPPFILLQPMDLISPIGIAIGVIVIEVLEITWIRSTCVFNLVVGIWGVSLVFYCYLDLDLQWVGLNCWGWVRVADWLFIFWIHLNWLSLQTIAFVFLFILEMVQLYHYKLMDISEWIAMGGSIRCEEMWVLEENSWIYTPDPSKIFNTLLLLS